MRVYQPFSLPKDHFRSRYRLGRRLTDHGREGKHRLLVTKVNSVWIRNLRKEQMFFKGGTECENVQMEINILGREGHSRCRIGECKGATLESGAHKRGQHCQQVLFIGGAHCVCWRGE